MRAFGKTVFRTVKNNIARLIAVTAIVMLGICFVSGLGALSPKILSTFDDSLRRAHVSDILVKATTATGLTTADTDAIGALDCVEAVLPFTALEHESETTAERLYLFGEDDGVFDGSAEVNRLTLDRGVFPTEATQCVVERASDTVEAVEIGDTVSFSLEAVKSGLPPFLASAIPDALELEVVGIVSNPLFFARDGDASLENELPLRQIVYAKKSAMVSIIPPAVQPYFNLPMTDAYVRVAGAQNSSVFSDGYKSTVDGAVNKLRAALHLPQTADEDNDAVVFLTLDENKSSAFLVGVTDKIDIIALLFPIFFILVTALVVLTTMTRMVEEERAAIGCYRTLGTPDVRIAGKYLLFAFVCCAVGIVVGNLVGLYLFPAVICPAFDIVFFLPSLVGAPDFTLGLISSATMLVAVMGITAYTATHSLRETPAALLKPKAPKPGKKIFLERIPFIWKRLPFKFKSMFRNVFRYVGRLLMIVISVAGSTALCMAGFGLRDVTAGGSITIGGIAVGNIGDSLTQIAWVVIIFAALLCVLVVYNLTNMDIGERKREIATLKVLGYTDLEVGGYIYREIFLMTFFGVLLGVPLGAGILAFIFYLLDFGAMRQVAWYSYLLAAAVAFLSVIIVDLLLYHKIVKEDMNESLKAVE